MWEYIDFYPLTIAGAGANHGLDPSKRPSPVVKHVHKASVAVIHGDTQCALKVEAGALGVGQEMDAVSADIANGWPSLQAHRIRFEFHKGAADHTYMRIDGEPWKQPLPEDDDTVMVEISHLDQVNMLASQNCIAKSIHDPSTPSSASTHQDDDDCGADDSDEELEERRKFGAADTFRLPDEDADIAHLT